MDQNNSPFRYSREAYERIKKFNGRRQLYPNEVAEAFTLFEMIEQTNGGCRTCPDNVRRIIDRVYHRFDEMHHIYSIEDEAKAKQEQEIKKEPTKPVTPTKKKK